MLISQPLYRYQTNASRQKRRRLKNSQSLCQTGFGKKSRGCGHSRSAGTERSGQSDPQVKAIASSILEGMRQEHQMGPHGYEGRSSSQWIVLDYGVVLVHIMHAEKRKFYRLEDLWSDAKRILVK